MATDAATETTSATGGETELGLSPNIEGVLAYVLGFVSGLVLLVLEDNEYVRYHAAQSVVYSVALIALFVALSLVGIVLGFIPVVGGLLGTLVGLVELVVRLGAFVGWLFLMYQAYSGERYRLPVLGAYVGSVESAI